MSADVFPLQEKNVSAWAGRDTTPTLLSHAWRIRSVLCRTKSAIFQGRPKCPLLVGLCLQSRLHHALPFFRNAHVIRNTANLLGRPFYGRWLTAISPCPFVPVEWASPRQPLLAQVLAYLCHNQEVTASHRFTGRRPRNAPRWTPYVAPLMERCYHQKNGGTGKLRKANATETPWREEWLTNVSVCHGILQEGVLLWHPIRRPTRANMYLS